MLISDWSSDLCYSELGLHEIDLEGPECSYTGRETIRDFPRWDKFGSGHRIGNYLDGAYHVARAHRRHRRDGGECDRLRCPIELAYAVGRSEQHTSELQSLMRISYAVFCLKKKTTVQNARFPERATRYQTRRTNDRTTDKN